MTMKRSIICLLSLAFAGCAAHHAAPQAARPMRAQDPVIVKLVGRDTTLVARASQHGPTYSIESSAGEVIVPAQTIETLRVQRPALAHEVDTLQANAWAGL
jgi:hypothetical protein